MSGQQTQESSHLHFPGANTTGTCHIHPGIQALDFTLSLKVPWQPSHLPVLYVLRILRVLVRILKLLLLFPCFGFCVDLCGSLLCLAGFVAANDLNKNYLEITPTSECLPSAAEPACVERILSDLPQTSLVLHGASHPHTWPGCHHETWRGFGAAICSFLTNTISCRPGLTALACNPRI